MCWRSTDVMLIANTLQFEVNRGGRFAEVLRLMQGKTKRPCDLTGRGPFSCTLVDPETEEELLEIEVEETNLADGRLTLTAEQEVMAEVPATVTRAVFEVRDAYETRCARGSLIFD